MATEKRLIDANALSEKIGNMKNEITCNRGGYQYCNEDEKNEWEKLDVFDSLVCDAPTVDAVEVVRCRDCAHWLNEDGLHDHVCLKIYSDGAVSSYAWQDRNPDDFCSYGERRTDNGCRRPI